MNTINETVNLYIAATKGGSVLCYGNLNSGLDYHISDLHRALFSDAVVNGTRRWDIMEHTKKWNRQCRSKVFKCKPVKVVITIKEVKKEGKKKRTECVHCANNYCMRFEKPCDNRTCHKYGCTSYSKKGETND